MPVYERFPGVWRVVLWRDGRQHERRVSGSREAAEEALEQLELEVPARGKARSHEKHQATWPELAGVYFVQLGLNGPIKVGVASSIRDRCANLQTGSPYPVYLRGYIVDGTEETEAAIHKTFRHLRMRGEWFRPGKDLLQYIASAWERRPLQ